MFTALVKAGVTGVRRRIGLVVLVWGVNLAFALAAAIPVVRALDRAVAPTGFGNDLALRFDLLLWAELVREIEGADFLHLAWILPSYLLWKAAAAAGLLSALSPGGAGSFLGGVRRHFLRSLALGLLQVPAAVLAAGIVVALGAAMGSMWKGETAAVRIWAIPVPVLLFCALAFVALMRDIARGALVVEGKGLWSAAADGLAGPFVRRALIPVYAAWLSASLAVTVLWPVVEMYAAATTVTLLVGLQLPLLCRAALSVGWHGSLASACKPSAAE